ncbi:uncharacterized protein LOC135847625 [Planococcus citri]|uniref:uncharacterized protein LOC135847625 n=1 Tax=Planococcus citri TaxID=170843 RepID=UPI0031F91A14
MYVESYHNRLKTFTFKRRPNQRLDILLEKLLGIEITLFLEREGKIRMKEPNIYEIGHLMQKKHELGMKIKDEDVKKIGTSWEIQSQTEKSITYTIVQYRAHCLNRDHCFAQCSEQPCNHLCAHMFSCSCPDPFPLCKHIHKVHFLCLSPHKSLAKFSSESNTDAKSSQSSVKLFSPISKGNKAVSLYDRIKQHYTSMADLFQDDQNVDMNDSCLKLLYQNMKQASEIYSSIKSPLNISASVSLPVKHISPNTKITPQAQLYRTNKRRKTKRDTSSRKKINFSLQNSHPSPYASFTVPLEDGVTLRDLQKTEITIGQYEKSITEKNDRYPISTLYFKSLDYYIPAKDFQLIHKFVPTFTRGWLYDFVIDAYLYILTTNNEELFAIETMAVQMINREPTSLENVRFLMLGTEDNLKFLGAQTFFIPLNLNQARNHWFLMVIEMKNKKVYIYDSNHQSTFAQHPHQNSLIKFACTIVNFHGSCVDAGWKIIIPKHAMQQDAHSCGVFVCWFVKQIIENESVEGPFDAHNFRKEIYETLTADPIPLDE